MTGALRTLERARELANGPAPRDLVRALDGIERARRERDALIREYRAAGVPYARLAHWSGLSERQLSRIAHER